MMLEEWNQLVKRHGGKDAISLKDYIQMCIDMEHRLKLRVEEEKDIGAVENSIAVLKEAVALGLAINPDNDQLMDMPGHFESLIKTGQSAIQSLSARKALEQERKKILQDSPDGQSQWLNNVEARIKEWEAELGTFSFTADLSTDQQESFVTRCRAIGESVAYLRQLLPGEFVIDRSLREQRRDTLGRLESIGASTAELAFTLRSTRSVNSASTVG